MPWCPLLRVAPASPRPLPFARSSAARFPSPLVRCPPVGPPAASSVALSPPALACLGVVSLVRLGPLAALAPSRPRPVGRPLPPAPPRPPLPGRCVAPRGLSSSPAPCSRPGSRPLSGILRIWESGQKVPKSGVLRVKIWGSERSKSGVSEVPESARILQKSRDF